MSSEINPNESTGQETVVEIGAGDAVSFEAMDSITDRQISEEKAERKASRADKATEPPAAKEEAATKAPPAAPNAEAKLAADVKKLKAKFGDTELEVPLEAMIEHTVDGQPVQVSIDELRNNYSGKVAYDKKFTELDVERRQFKAERGALDQAAEEFVTMASSKDVNATAILTKLGQLANMENPLQFVRDLRSKLEADFKARMSMSEEGRKAADLVEENEFLRQGQASRQATEAEQAQRAATLAKVAEVREARGMSEEVFKSTLDEILSEGIVPEESITPEYVGDWYMATKAYDKAEASLTALASKDNPEVDGKVVAELARIIKNDPSISDERIGTLAAAFMNVPAKKAQQALSKKVLAASPSRTDEQPRAAAAKNPNTEPLNFDDLE